MAIFSADELADMRATLEETLEGTCTRQRYAAGAEDDYGNPTQGALSASVFACRLVPAPGNERTTDREAQVHDAAFLIPHDADVVGSDRIVHDGVTWEILGPTVTQSWTTHQRVIARRVEGA